MTHAWWAKFVSPYYNLYKAENQQSSHNIFIASAINSESLKNLEPYNFLLWQLLIIQVIL